MIAIESPPPRSPGFQVRGHQHQRRPLVWAHPALFTPVVQTLRLPEIIWLLFTAAFHRHHWCVHVRGVSKGNNTLLYLVLPCRALHVTLTRCVEFVCQCRCQDGRFAGEGARRDDVVQWPNTSRLGRPKHQALGETQKN